MRLKKFQIYLYSMGLVPVSLASEVLEIDPDIQRLQTTIYVERKVAADHKSCEADSPPLDYKLYNTGRMLADNCVEVHEKNRDEAYKQMLAESQNIEKGDTEAYLQLQAESEQVNRTLVISNKFCLKTANQMYWAALRFSYIKAWKLDWKRDRCIDAWKLSIDVNSRSCKRNLVDSLKKFEEIEKYTSQSMPIRKRQEMVSTLEKLIGSNNCSKTLTLKQKNRCHSYVKEIKEDMVNCSYKKTTLIDKLRELPHDAVMAFLDLMANPALAGLDSTYKERSKLVVEELTKSNINSSEFFQEPYSRGALYYQVAKNLKDSANTFDKIALNHVKNASESTNVVSSLDDQLSDSSSMGLDGLSNLEKPLDLSSQNLNALSKLSNKTGRCFYGKDKENNCNLLSTNGFGIDISQAKKSFGEGKTARTELQRLSKFLTSITPFSNALNRGNPFTQEAVESARRTEKIMSAVNKNTEDLISKLAKKRKAVSKIKEPNNFFNLASDKIKKLNSKDSRILASLGSGSMLSDIKKKIGKQEEQNDIDYNDQSVNKLVLETEKDDNFNLDGQAFSETEDLSHNANFDNYSNSEEEYEIPVEAQIVTRRDISIFEVISNRYFKSGFDKLEGK